MRNRNLVVTLGDLYYGLQPNRILKKISKTQYKSLQEIEKLQLEQLKIIVEHSCKNVPFYKEYSKTHNIQINTLQDISKLPIIDKKIINNNYSSFISDIAKKPYSIAKTTGSTGVPFSFIKTREGESYKIASRLRAKNWFGVGRCDQVLKVSGIPPQNQNLKKRILEHIRFWATKKNEIFISEMTDDNIPTLVKKINKINPIAIIGLAGGVALLSTKLKGNKQLICKPKAIFTNSESITPLQKKQIFDCFGLESRSDYAATEGSIAHECEFGGLHLDMEECYAEIINIDEEGVGDLILSFLHSYDMPLLRYKIGDKAKWGESFCKCGRGLRLIDNVIGREVDVITLPNGKEYSSANINYVPSNLKYVNNLSEYQLFQQTKNSILIKVVLNDKNDTQVVTELKEEFEKIFEECNVSVSICDSLERGKTGKLRIINSIE